MPRPLPPDSPAAALVTEEEELLVNVNERVKNTSDDGAPIADYDADLIELRDAIAEAKPEDLPPLVEQMARLQGIASRRGRSRSLPVDPNSPYFAHMRLKELGKERDVLIGKRGFIDRAGGVSIVDWRNAPVSQIYYRYEEGDDFDETFDGRRLEGVVTARRNVSIHAGRLRRIGCPAGTYVRDVRGVWHEAEGAQKPVLQGGQGTAARAPRPQPNVGRQKQKRGHGHGQQGAGAGRQLGVEANTFRADKHLPEIAALIDKEQWDLITQPDIGLVLIQGGAGSGKTTVALHRVSYLAFNAPHRFSPRKMLVVVPSIGLARYVEGVLPALGTTGVPVVTMRQWAGAERKKLVPRAGDRYADDTPDAVAKVKKHPALLTALEVYCGEQLAAHIAAIGAMCAGHPAGPLVVDKLAKLGKEAHVPRLGKLLGWLGKPETEAQIPAELRLRVEAEVRRLRKRASDVRNDWEEVLTDLERLKTAFAEHPDVRPGELMATVSWCSKQKDQPSDDEYRGIDADRLVPVDGEPLDREDERVGGRVDPEDDPIYLRLHQIKRGGLIDKDGNENRYEHIAIDEAQDFSAVEVKVLLEATTAQRSVTIAGDTAQRLVFDNHFKDWRSLLSDAGHGAVEIRPLKLSYRSTAEIMHFSRAVLGPLADPDQPLVARNGAPVGYFRFDETGEAVAFLAEALRSLVSREPTSSIAVIARHAEQADVYYDALKRAEVPALRRVKRHDFPFTPGVDVTDVAQVKGLEFDYVILVETTGSSYPDNTEARHLLHIGATRAAHQLWLVASGDPSPLLPKDLVDEVW